MSINFMDEAAALHPRMVEVRRDLHQHPEIAFEEVRTAGIVADELRALGLEVQTGVGKTGVVGILEGDGDGPTVLVRADMDALPIHEDSTADYVSQTDGKMHACGHDGHTSIGLAVAKMLSERRAEMNGRVKFVFQPAEEIGQGAKAMVADGVLESPKVDYSVGLHLWNEMPVGEVAVTPGPCMSTAESWRATITGSGGHGANPHETHDPIVAAAQIISALQTIVSRNVDPLESGVVTVGAIHGGDAFNVIPPEVELRGTIRTYLKETQELIHQRMQDIIHGIANSMGCEADFEVLRMTLAVSNDIELSKRISAIAADVVGVENIHDDERTMGSEDMAYLMDDIPGCYFFVGSRNSEMGFDAPHHHPAFDIDEDALRIGAAILASAAASFVLPE